MQRRPLRQYHGLKQRGAVCALQRWPLLLHRFHCPSCAHAASNTPVVCGSSAFAASMPAKSHPHPGPAPRPRPCGHSQSNARSEPHRRVAQASTQTAPDSRSAKTALRGPTSPTRGRPAVSCATRERTVRWARRRRCHVPQGGTVAWLGCRPRWSA